MRLDLPGRVTGTACSIAGCAPLLFTSIVGAAGASGSSAAGSMLMTAMPMTGGAPEPAWIAALGAVSWPLLAASAVLIIWGFWRARAAARAFAFAAVAALIVNRIHMTLWIFLPAMALLTAAFVLSAFGRGARTAAA